MEDNQKPIYPGYRKAEINYKEICKKKGHTISRTELAHCNRELYKTIKKWEQGGKIVPFIGGTPLDILHLDNAGRAKNLIAKIEDTPRNKTKAYRQFNEDKDISFKYLGMNYPI